MPLHKAPKADRPITKPADAPPRSWPVKHAETGETIYVVKSWMETGRQYVTGGEGGVYEVVKLGVVRPTTEPVKVPDEPFGTDEGNDE